MRVSKMLGTLTVLLWACVPQSSGSGGGDDGGGSSGSGGTVGAAGVIGGGDRGDGGAGGPCTTDDDCEAGPCLVVAETGQCVDACGADGACPPGYRCLAEVCVPDSASGMGGALGGGGAPIAGGDAQTGGEDDAGGAFGGGGRGGMPNEGGQTGGGGEPVPGGQEGPNPPQLCGEDLPFEQCLAACEVIGQCWIAECDFHVVGPQLVEECGERCPNPAFTEAICVEEPSCERVLEGVFRDEPNLEMICTEEPDPCAEIDCGEHGFCFLGECDCDAGYEGPRCEQRSNLEETVEACQRFMACQAECGDDDDCVSRCENRFAEGAFAYLGLYGCGQRTRCIDRDGRVDEACLRERCPENWEECYPPGS